MKVLLPERIKAVIFDVDGVIINSEPAWKKTHDDFLGINNIAVTEEYKASLRGIGLKELVIQLKEKFHLDRSIDDLLEQYRKLFYKNFLNSPEMHLLEGVEECVKMFYEQGYEMAIATGGHTPQTMSNMLATFNLLKYFPLVISSDEVERGKPQPDVFLHTAERLGRKPEECLVIEDSVNGVQAAKAAAMMVYGVNSHEKIYKQLKHEGADEVFYSLTEIKV